MKHLPAHVFRAYDIRGVAEQDITEELCNSVGKGFGSELRDRYNIDHPHVVVGRDARTHSPALEAALIEGLKSTGCHVLHIGQVPSPVNYFALCHLDADGSIQVTASHNPKEDNGLKLQTRGAEAYAGNDVQQLRTRIEKEQFATGAGSLQEHNVIEAYLEKVLSLATNKADTPLTIVADFGNGVSGPVYAEALKRMGMQLTTLYEEPDGMFPNHPADPSKHSTLKDLIAKVRELNADCGLAFDGDGDRVGVVDEHGNVIAPDYLLLLLAQDHLRRNPGSSIVYTVSMSSILQTEVENMGGTSTMCEVGHSFVEHTMHKVNSHLGAEQSGHIFCGEDYYDYDDALVAAVRILDIVKHHKKRSAEATLSSLIEQFPKIYQTPEYRPHCDDDKKTGIVHRITKHFEKHYPCVTIDGVRIDFGDGAWAGIRQSNTSPKISVCIEARSQAKLDEVEQIVREHLDGYAEIGGED